MIVPPTTGPAAVAMPTAAPIIPNALPRSAGGNSCCTRPETWGLISPPDNPCSTRPAMRTAGLGANPTIALVTTNAAMPNNSIGLRPRSSPSRPPMIGTMPNARA
jgi:hypothetical protein